MKKKLVLTLALASFTHHICPDIKIVDKEEPKSFVYDEVVYNWSRTFAEILHIVGQKHYKVNDLEQAFVHGIDAFLTYLDPHSSFLDPKTYKQILETTSGEFFGIGIVIDATRQNKDKYLIVIDAIPGGPAEKGGIKPLDKIIEIEGKSLEGMNTDEATALLKGEKGTKVTIKVLREGQPDLLTFEITRDVVKEQNSLAFYIPEHNISYISLNMFTETAIKQISELLKLSKQQKYKGLILDLRNNSGGLLTSAIDIAGLFLDKGSLVVTTKDKTNKETDRYVTKRDPIAQDALPIFILINNYTASAAEILAGALKMHSIDASNEANGKPQKKLMVFLVGAKSFGKGSVQEVMSVSNNSAIKLTTSLYFLPHDISIQGIGIEPDFCVDKKLPPTEQIQWFTKYYGRESALPNYIKVTVGEGDKAEKEKDEAESLTEKKQKNMTERARSILETDNQVRDTISLINMLNTGKSLNPNLVSTREKAIKFLNENFINKDKISLIEIKV